MQTDLLKQKIFDELREHATKFHNWNYKEIHYHCFKSPAGYRLSYEGLGNLQVLYNTYEFKITVPITSRHLITLTREIKYPYYISKNRLVLFGGQDAFILKIHGSNIPDWLDSMAT